MPRKSKTTYFVIHAGLAEQDLLDLLIWVSDQLDLDTTIGYSNGENLSACISNKQVATRFEQELVKRRVVYETTTEAPRRKQYHTIEHPSTASLLDGLRGKRHRRSR